MMDYTEIYVMSGLAIVRGKFPAPSQPYCSLVN